MALHFNTYVRHILHDDLQYFEHVEWRVEWFLRDL